MEKSLELPGLRVVLDQLAYHYNEKTAEIGQPHAFVYFLSIHNDSDRTVTLLARKWIIESPGEGTIVVEGDKIVGQTPTLKPGEQFSYNSYHVTGVKGIAHGSFHGVDESGKPVFVKIPPFELNIPED